MKEKRCPYNDKSCPICPDLHYITLYEKKDGVCGKYELPFCYRVGKCYSYIKQFYFYE